MDFKYTTLKESPHKYQETLKLIEKSLEYTPPYKFENDFYPLISASNHQHNYLIIKDKSVIAHIGLNIRLLKKENLFLRVGLIGGIAIKQSYRKQGIFKSLFNSIIDKYKDEVGCFLLWSNESKLYEKFGFYEFGSITQTGKKNLKETDAEKFDFKKVTLSKLSIQDQNTIKDLYSNQFKKYISIQRSDHDWEAIKKITSADLYIKKYNEKIMDYFFINKGFDLSGIIHEISFSENKKLIRHFSPYKLWIPQKSQPFFPSSSSLFLGFLKISNKSLFSNFIQAICNNDILITKIQNTVVSFNFQNNQFDLKEKEFISMIFGPTTPPEFLKYSNYFFLSGLDSI